MFNHQMLLRLGEQKTADLRREAAEHRLASTIRRPAPAHPSLVRARLLAGAWVTALGAVLLLIAR
jgi:hypothetical protein